MPPLLGLSKEKGGLEFKISLKLKRESQEVRSKDKHPSGFQVL
jgi:hypothetical protein